MTNPLTVPAKRAAAYLLETGRVDERFGLDEVAHIIDRKTGLPELLEACQALLERHVDCLDRDPNLEQDHELFDARAAIAKAEGKE